MLVHRLDLTMAKKAEKCGFRTRVTDIRNDGWTDERTNGRKDRWMDRPSFRDAFLTDTSKKRWLTHFERSVLIKAQALVQMT